MLNKSTYRVVEDVDPYRYLRINLTDKFLFINEIIISPFRKQIKA